MTPTVVEQLASFAARLDLADVPPPVLDKARACLAHGLTVAAAGRVTPVGRAAESAIGPGDGPCRLLTSPRRAPVAQAAFVNSALSHARGQEDTHGTAHLGSILIPAALATAEQIGADGRTFLAGMIAGYEVGAALSTPYTGRSSARGFRASPIYGVFAAAAAAGRILELDEAQLATALSYAAAFAGGTLESFAAGSMEWHFQNATAAQNGVNAARLAAAGVRGAPRALEGDAGFLLALVGTTDGADEIARHLGQRWETNAITFKHYPVCAFNQIPVTAAAALARDEGLTAADIAGVTVEMNAYEAGYPGVNHHGPYASTGQTLMSAQFCIATGLARQDVTYADLKLFTDPEVTRIAASTRVVAQLDRTPMTTRIGVTTQSGRYLERTIDDPLAELSWPFRDSRDHALRLLAEGGLRECDLDALLAAIADLENNPVAATVLDPLMTGWAS